MADRGDTHYKVSTLNMWFLLSSGFLLVATAWMVIDDWNAPWKKYQAEFRKIDEVRTRDRIESADEALAKLGDVVAKAISPEEFKRRPFRAGFTLRTIRS